ncbi:response regulator transcription factor [Chitinophaga lutea]
MAGNFLTRYKHLLLYGGALAILLFLLKWLELRFLIIDHAMHLYSGAIALLFTLLGAWLAMKLARPKKETIIVERRVAIPSGAFELNEPEIGRLGLSARELEVLTLMAEGLSNQEIAGRLFLSLNTVKTHSSRLFEKMDVRRRTQAVEKAKRLSIIP